MDTQNLLQPRKMDKTTKEGEMKAKTKFMKMYYKLPEKARKGLIFGYPNHPMTLNVVMAEVNQNTIYGKKILDTLGYIDDNEAE